MRIRSFLPAALFLAACAPAAPPAPQPEGVKVARPALWKLADEDTTIYLFGTIHVLPKNYVWESAALTRAVAAADELVIETVVGQDPQAAAAMLLGSGAAAGLPPLVDRVAPDKKDALAGVIARSGLPPAMLDGMKTWTAALMLTGVTLADLGLDAQSGVEEQLKTRFAAGHKPISGLEKPDEQLGFLDSLPEREQRDFLESVVDDPAKARKEFDEMLAAWTRGDEKAIAATFDGAEEITPALRAVLLDRRNAAWAIWLKRRLDRPGTVLVAVGAGHLAGRDSVQTKLEAEGLHVVRVQ